MNFVDVCVDQVLSSLANAPVPTSREERFLASMVCKNLADLCETGRSILEDMRAQKISTANLPNTADIETCQNILSRFFDEKMFIENEEYGIRPEWREVLRFEKVRGDGACKLYHCIKHNVVDKPLGTEIQRAAQTRNVHYFVTNFDRIFKDVPFKEALSKFKNFVATSAVTKEHQDYIWEFFDSLLEIFLQESEILGELRTCR